MARKYLDEIGVKSFTPDKKDKRWKKFRKEIKIRGFPSYECWNLHTTFIEWMYEHLAAYLEDADKIINLDFHKFEFENKTYTQREAIEYIMKAYGVYLTWLDDVDYDIEHELMEKTQRATRLLAEILPALWW